jgi:hypothetical protein
MACTDCDTMRVRLLWLSHDESRQAWSYGHFWMLIVYLSLSFVVIVLVLSPFDSLGYNQSVVSS